MYRNHVVSLLISIGALLFLARDTYPESLQEIMVSAAMSLKNPFEEIGKEFELKHRGVKVYFNFGASGDLRRQVEGGAPADVFASASLQDMDELEKKGIIVSGTRLNFAENELVLIEPLHAGQKLSSFDDLRKREVERVAIGNPKTSPVGKYAEEILRHYSLFDAVRDKLVFGEHVRQVLDYVARGEVDAGMVYVTDARLRPGEVRIVLQAPEGSHTPAVYPIAVVRGTSSESLSKEFVMFVVSGEASKIIQRFGFKPPYRN